MEVVNSTHMGIARNLLSGGGPNTQHRVDIEIGWGGEI